MTEIQGKSILVRVRARSELARVRVRVDRIKIQPNTIDLSTKLQGINPTNSVVRSIVLG